MIHCILAHLVGDFLLQNDWMQKKTASNWHCLIHVVVYLVPFLFAGLSGWQIAAIGLQHFFQDRFGWAEKWQKLFRQTPSDKWPTGRLLVDQTLHILFMAWVVSSSSTRP